MVQIADGPSALIALALIVALTVWRRPSFWISVVGVGALVLGGAFIFRAWDHVTNDDEFCISCHQEPFERFSQSGHSELECRDCHRQPMSASLRQVAWAFDRPAKVGPHAQVPPGVCVECHVTEDPDSTWQRISATVGHRVHIEADTSALQGFICVKCHGQELHRFIPADSTCGQSGCHDPSKTDVVLGEMAGQTVLHCVTCHEFTAPATEQAHLDTVRGAFIPALAQCSSCHEMEKVLVGLDPAVDPHDAVCGTCHFPHTDEAPAEAASRCAECHGPAESLTPFHRGLRSVVVQNCLGCHEAHTFRVEGEDCLACHADILGEAPTAGPRRPTRISSARERGKSASAFLGPGSMDRILMSLVDLDRKGSSHLRPSQLDTDQYIALRTWTSPASTSGVEPGGWGELTQQQPRFDHGAHRDVRCMSCHSMEQSHGEITLESRRECSECHHTRPVVDRGCQSCHRGPAAPAVESTVVPMRLKVGEGSQARELPFSHGRHAALACSACHTGGPQLAAQGACGDCHEDHHQPDRNCMTCHREPPPSAHTIAVHTEGCSGAGCHGPESYGRLGVGRETCLACHRGMRDHKPGRACAACHQVSPIAHAAFGGA